MITRSRIENIKGITGEHILTGADLFLGNNGSGKTANIEAINTAILGYTPGKKKDMREIMKNASASSMCVELFLDTGFLFSRAFTRNTKIGKTGAKSISYSQSIAVEPSHNETMMSDLENRIKSELGDFPVMIDFDVFLGLSDAQKRDYLMSMVDSEDGWDEERLKDHLERELLTTDLYENAPDRYTNMQDLISDLVSDLDYSDINSAVDELIKTIKVRKKKWEDEFKRSSGATQKIAELKNNLSVSDRNIRQHKAELSEMEQQLGKVNAKLLEHDTKMNTFQKQQNRKLDIERRIEEMEESTPKELPGYDQELKSLIDSHITVPNVSEELAPLKKEKADCHHRIENANQKILELTEEIAEYKARQRQYQHIIDQVAKMDSSEVKHCVISSKITCEKDFSRATAGSSKQIEKYQGLINNRTNHVMTLKREIASAKEKLTELDQKEAVLIEKVESCREKNRDLDNQIQNLKQAKQKRDGEIKSHHRSIAQYKEELLNLQRNPLPAPESNEMLSMQKVGLAANIADLKEKISTEEEAKITYATQQSTMISTEKAAIYKENLKYLLETAGPKGLQGELLKGQLSGINSKVNDNLKLLGIDNPFYFQTESEKKKEIFQFGWVREGMKIDFNALSGAEQIILMVALLVAFIEVKQPKERILVIDNIDRVHPRNVPKLLSGLLKIKEKLDNIILSGALEDIEAPGWNIIKLEGGLYAGSDNAEQRTA